MKKYFFFSIMFFMVFTLISAQSIEEGESSTISEVENTYVEYETIVGKRIVTLYGFHNKDEFLANIDNIIPQTYFKGIDSNNLNRSIELLTRDNYVDEEILNFIRDNNLEYCFYVYLYENDLSYLEMYRVYKSLYFSGIFSYREKSNSKTSAVWDDYMFQ